MVGGQGVAWWGVYGGRTRQRSVRADAWKESSRENKAGGRTRQRSLRTDAWGVYGGRTRQRWGVYGGGEQGSGRCVQTHGRRAGVHTHGSRAGRTRQRSCVQTHGRRRGVRREEWWRLALPPHGGRTRYRSWCTLGGRRVPVPARVRLMRAESVERTVSGLARIQSWPRVGGGRRERVREKKGRTRRWESENMGGKNKYRGDEHRRGGREMEGRKGAE